MNTGLRLPDSDAWTHTVAVISETAENRWAAVVAGACAKFIEDPLQDRQSEDAAILEAAARFLVARVVSWAPGRNGIDSAADLGPAMAEGGITGCHATVVEREWAVQGNALLAAARLGTVALISTGSKASPSFIEYTGCGVHVASGSSGEPNQPELESQEGRHDPVAWFTLPPGPDGTTAHVELTPEQTYALFCQLDAAQREIDALFETGDAHADPAQ